MAHPRCVGWGEMGLDYHYDNSPRDIQQAVFSRQLKQAIRLRKPLTIHTREADHDTERILKEEVPKDHPVWPLVSSLLTTFWYPAQIHIHCFTDSPGFASRLLDHFSNLYIGITGKLIIFHWLPSVLNVRFRSYYVCHQHWYFDRYPEYDFSLDICQHWSSVPAVDPRPCSVVSAHSLRNRCTLHGSGKPVQWPPIDTWQEATHLP